MITTYTQIKTQAKTVVATVSTPNEFLEIFEDVHSGHVATREKIQTLNGVMHPCIIIGKDKYNRIWVAHNHIDHKRPVMETLEGYSLGQKIILDNTPVNYSHLEIMKRAIAEVLKGKKYNAITYNCQIFVNIIVRNDNFSESIDVISDRTFALGAFTTLVGLLTKSKALTTMGAVAMTGAGAAKVYNKNK